MSDGNHIHMHNDPAASLKMIGERLKRLRRLRGYPNYEEFAYKFNISRSQVSRHETGSDLRLTSLIRMLNALEVSIFDFFSQDFDSIFPEKN